MTDDAVARADGVVNDGACAATAGRAHRVYGRRLLRRRRLLRHGGELVTVAVWCKSACGRASGPQSPTPYCATSCLHPGMRLYGSSACTHGAGAPSCSTRRPCSGARRARAGVRVLRVGVWARLGAAEPDALLHDLILTPGHEALRPAGVYAACRPTGGVCIRSSARRSTLARSVTAVLRPRRRSRRRRRPSLWRRPGTTAQGSTVRGRAHRARGRRQCRVGRLQVARRLRDDGDRQGGVLSGAPRGRRARCPAVRPRNRTPAQATHCPSGCTARTTEASSAR